MKKDLKMYILINDDIKISKGKLAGQVGHAVASYFYNSHNDLTFHIDIDEYMEGLQKKIILKCPQSKLEELEKEGFISIRDVGLTQLEPNTLTCINLGIHDCNNRHEYFDFLDELKLVN